jgi:predicted enzyme related to lactoylglutathione lyase
MSTAFLGLRTVIYKVSDLDKAKAWYSKVFDALPYFDESFHVGFTIGGYELGLQPDENPVTKKSENVLVYWGVEDVQKEYDRLIARGASEHEAPQNVGGEIVVATVKDPWDNVLGIIYNPEFKFP